MSLPEKRKGHWFSCIYPLLIAAFLGLLLWPALGLASDDPALVCNADPMVKITSLPLKGDLNQIMAKISGEVAREAGFSKKVVTYYWQTFDAVFCPGCEEAKLKKPIFVDVYVPAFVGKEQRKKLMTSLAEALARHTDYTTQEVFIALRELARIFHEGRASGFASGPYAALPAALAPQCSFGYTYGARLPDALPLARWLCRAEVQVVLRYCGDLFHMGPMNTGPLVSATQPS